jgi:hypothetical protein
MPVEDVDERKGLTRGGVVSNLTLVGTDPVKAHESGLLIEGGRFRLDNVRIVNCHTGISVRWSVDVTIRDCVVSRNFSTSMRQGPP